MNDRENMAKPTSLTASFVRGVEDLGRYGDGRGRFGLSLLVRRTKDGGVSRNWQQRVRIPGRGPTSLGLGSYPAVSLSEARDLAAENAMKIRTRFPRKSGIDRLLEKAGSAANPGSAGPTFRDMAEGFIDFRRPTWTGAKTEKQMRSLLEGYAYPVIGDVPIEQVTSSHVLEVVGPIWSTKAESAKKLMRAVSGVFENAFAEGFDVEDPTKRAKAGLGRQRNTVTHHAAVDYAEVQAVIAYLRTAKTYPSKRAALAFAILTAARTGEVRGARWSEVDMDKATWTIPADRMKGGREHRVPLSPEAMNALKKAKLRGYSLMGLVFPNESGEKEISEDGLRQLLRNRFTGKTVHGFRSTFRDWAAEKTDFPAEIAEHALAHLEGSETVRAYLRTDFFDKRRELMDDWGAFVMG